MPASTPAVDRSMLQLIEAALPNARPESRTALLELARIRSCARGEAMFQQGELIPLVLMCSGFAAFRRTTVNGQQLLVGIADPGHLFGLGSIAGVTTPVDVLALSATEIATWPGATVRQLATTDPGLATDVIDRLALFLTVLTEKVDGFLHQDARQRVVRVLSHYREFVFGDAPVVPRSQLPGLVGTSREMTGRVLRELEAEGTIARVGRAGLRLLRPEGIGLPTHEAQRPSP